MSKFTPGPWELTTREGQPSKPWNGSESICIVKSEGPMTGYIAAMITSGHWGKKLANAHLIAAAPELLEACKSMVADFDLGEYSIKQSLAMIKTAIAKATA